MVRIPEEESADLSMSGTEWLAAAHRFVRACVRLEVDPVEVAPDPWGGRTRTKNIRRILSDFSSEQA